MASTMTTADERWRALEKLFVHRETLRCAETRCVACCYKIALYSRPGLLPNVRPELCPRMASGSAASEAPDNDGNAKVHGRVGLYAAAGLTRVLTVGDGNFSFSLALARALAPQVEVVATSHESRESVLETYPDGERILGGLGSLDNVKVLHGVDATDEKQMHELGLFDRVLWNFPCVRAPRGEDGQNKEMEINKKLLRDFFAHVGGMLTPSGEVHVTHKTKAPFGQWGIEAIAEENALEHTASCVFDRCLYPGYSNKKVLSKGSFPIWDSQTFIFVPAGRTKIAESKSPQDEEGEKEPTVPMEDVTPVTMELLKKVYLLLSPTLEDTFGGKRKKKSKKPHPQVVGGKRKQDSGAPTRTKRGGEIKHNKRGETPGKKHKKRRF